MKTIMKNLRDMTVVTAAVALFVAIFAIPVPCATAANNAQQEQTYTKPGTIWSEIDGGFTVLDERGQIWAFYADPDSFIVGQEVEQKKQDEYRKQAERDAEEAAQKRTVSAGRFVAPKQPSEVQPTENNNLWIVSISYANGTHTVTEYEDEGVAKQCYEVIQFMDKKRKNSALVRMALIHNDRTVKSYDRD